MSTVSRLENLSIAMLGVMPLLLHTTCRQNWTKTSHLLMHLMLNDAQWTGFICAQTLLLAALAILQRYV